MGKIIGLALSILVLIAVWFLTIPFLLMLLVNSITNLDLALWQTVLIWFFVTILCRKIRFRGGNKNGN